MPVLCAEKILAAAIKCPVLRGAVGWKPRNFGVPKVPEHSYRPERQWNPGYCSGAELVLCRVPVRCTRERSAWGCVGYFALSSATSCSYSRALVFSHLVCFQRLQVGISYDGFSRLDRDNAASSLRLRVSAPPQLVQLLLLRPASAARLTFAARTTLCQTTNTPFLRWYPPLRRTTNRGNNTGTLQG